MKPFITLKSGTRLRLYDIRMYTESHRWEFGVQKEPTGSFVELFSRENRLHVSDSPAEIDALIEAALADQQPAPREPQAALPRTDEPQDTIARLEAIRAKNPMFWWAIACPQPDNMQFRVFIGRLGITERTLYGDTIEEAVEAAIKEIGNG